VTIIKRIGDDVVLYAGNVTLTEAGVQGEDFVDTTTTPDVAVQEEISALPEGWFGAGWSYTNGVWTQVAQRPEPQTRSAQHRREREERNKLLSQSDWTQIDDAPLTTVQKAAWALYRQALRDLPQQEGFPRTVSWPSPPA
jgi:hypothetical protein